MVGSVGESHPVDGGDVSIRGSNASNGYALVQCGADETEVPVEVTGQTRLHRARDADGTAGANEPVRVTRHARMCRTRDANETDVVSPTMEWTLVTHHKRMEKKTIKNSSTRYEVNEGKRCPITSYFE